MSPDVLGFSARVEDRLSKLGWSPNRCVQIDEGCQELHKSGFTVHSFARQVLANLQGLRFRGTQGVGPGMATFRSLYFDAIAASDYVDEFSRLCMENIAGESVCPVADVECACLLVLGSKRAMLLNEQWFFLKISKTLDQMLAYIFDKDESGIVNVPLDASLVPPGCDDLVTPSGSLSNDELGILAEIRRYGLNWSQSLVENTQPRDRN